MPVREHIIVGIAYVLMLGHPFAGLGTMWTDEDRARYDRSKLRYPSDLTDREWSLIEPLIPPAKPGGNRRTVVDAMSSTA